MTSAMVEVTLSKFRDFVRHFWKLDLSAVDYNSEEDFRLIFDKYLGVEFRFKREEPKKTDLGLEAALKDIWSKNTGADCTDEASLNEVPVKVKEEIEPKNVETRRKRKIYIDKVKQEIKNEPFIEQNNKSEVAKSGPNDVSGSDKIYIEKELKSEKTIVNLKLDSKTDRGMKIEKSDQILIVPKDKKFKDITQCSLCMFQASSSHTLKVHIEMNHLNLRFHCNICQRNTKEKYVMKDHMKKIHEEDDLSKLDFECRRCDLREPFQAFRDHINLFHPDLIFFYPNHPFSTIKAEKTDMKCSFCAYSAPKPNLLNSHVESSHINAEYRCNECNFTCKKIIEIRNHTSNNHAPDGVKRTKGEGVSRELRHFFKRIISKKCITCKQNMEYREDFTRHIQLNHPDSFVQSKRERRKRDGIKREELSNCYHCSECDYSSGFISNLRTHIMLIHMMTRFSCNECTFKSNSLAFTKKHVRSDHNDRMELINSLCTKCGYAEDSIAMFETHIRNSHMSHISLPTGRSRRRISKSKKKEKRVNKMKKKRGRKARIVSHDEKPTYNCTECDIETQDKGSIIEHIFENHDVNENLEEDEQLDDIVKYLKVSCTNCEFKGSFAEYDDHIASNPSKKPGNIRCTICASDSSNETDLLLHRLTVHGKAKLVCKECGFESSKINEQIKHGRTEHVKQCFRMSCGFCGIKLSRSALEDHLLEKHPEEFNSKKNIKPLLKCEECDYQHISELRLNRHINKIHATLECPHCGEGFEVRKKMMYHIAIKHKIHTFDCQQCKFKTKHESALYRHTISFHTNKKRFVCEVCDKAFSRRDNRDAHMTQCLSK